MYSEEYAVNDVIIRTAEVRDAAALLKIYSYYVENTPITFELILPSLKEFEDRIAEYSKSYPYLVCEVGGEIVGYAYAHMHQQREANKFSAETSVYLAKEQLHKGLGSILYQELISQLKKLPVRNLYAAVCVPNPASEALHERFGFHEAGHWHNVAYKLGKWRDLKWYELELCSGTEALSKLIR